MSKLNFLFALPIFFAVTTPTYATDGSPMPSGSPGPRELRQEVRQEIRQEVKDTRVEIQGQRQELRSDIAGNHATRLERRFAAYYTRMTNIATRITNRITTLKNSGKDTTAVQTKLDAAKATLESAKTKGAEAVAAFRAIDPAKFSEQKDKAIAARDLAMAARKLFVQASQELKATVVELKKI